MKKRLLCIIAAITVSLCLSGCNIKINKIPAVPNSTVQTESDTAESGYITDWSLEDMVRNIELNGKTYSMPLTFEDMADDYLLGETVPFENGTYGRVLYHYDTGYPMVVRFSGDDGTGDDYKKSIINAFSISNDYDFKVGDISCGDDRQEILKKYGEPSMEVQESEDVYQYFYAFETEDGSGYSSLLLVFENDKLAVVTVRYGAVE